LSRKTRLSVEDSSNPYLGASHASSELLKGVACQGANEIEMWGSACVEAKGNSGEGVMRCRRVELGQSEMLRLLWVTSD